MMKLNLKSSLLSILIIFLLIFLISERTYSIGVQKEEQEKVSPEKESESKIENTFYTFSEIKTIKDVPSMFKFFKNFISWKHWRYWVSILIPIAAWFILILITPNPNRIFSEKNAKKFEKRENIAYISMWLIYSFITAIFFTFGYDHLIAFFENVSLFKLPVDQHWIHWILWSGLVLLVVGAIVDVLYNFIVFKLIAPYVLILHILQGIFMIFAIFLLTTMLTYLIIGLGIVIGVILVAIIGIGIIIALLNDTGQSISSSSGSYSNNSNQKKINDAARRERERMEKFNRESMKNTRGW